MPPVIIGGAIAAAGAVGAAAIGNSGAKSAAKTTQQGTDAAIASQNQARAESNAALAPWQQSGLQANSLLQSAYGFGQPAQPAAQPAAQYGAPGANVSPLAAYKMGSPFGSGAYPAFSGYNAPQQGQMVQAQAPNPQNAFDTFLNSTDYNWVRNQGMDALNSGYAGRGVLQSGAAVKGALDYNNHLAQGAYQNWIGGVENIANRGYGAANAQSGVATNIGANVSNLQAANSNALANLQIAKANNTASAIGGLGAIGANVFGNVLGTNQQPNNALVAPSSTYPMSGAYVRQF